MGLYPALYMNDLTLFGVPLKSDILHRVLVLAGSITRFSLLSEDAKIFRSSVYRRSVTFTLMGLDSL